MLRETKLSELKSHPLNPRRGNVEVIMESIREHGFYGSLIAQVSTQYVLKGNHTLIALKRLGYDSVSVDWLDIDDKEAEEILSIDNRASDMASYDSRELMSLLALHEERFGTLEGTGYEKADLIELQKKLSGKGPSEFATLDLTKRSSHECPRCGHQF